MTRAGNVLDMFHGDNREAVPDFVALSKAGVLAVFHKATQGSEYIDPRYHIRQQAARAAGMPFHAYHFLDDTDAATQARHFWAVAGVDPRNETLAADYETNGGASPDLGILKTFLGLVDSDLGHPCVLYSGNLIRETYKPDPQLFDWWREHPLWLAEYGPVEKIPAPWDKATCPLWQYSDTGTVGGVAGHVDLSFFDGTADQLRKALGIGAPMPANQTEQPAHPPAPASTNNQTGAPQMGDTLGEIEAALQAAETELPQLIGVLSLFIPGLKSIIPFLNLLPVAIQAVDTVHKAIAPTGGTQGAAVAAVVNTLTPGQPGAPALN